MNTCLGQVSVCALRVARLQDDGVPLPGADNLYVSDALAELTVTAVYTDGEEIEENNACGATLVSYRAPDTFKRLDFTLNLVIPDPELSEMLSQNSEAITASGGRVGYGYPSIGQLPSLGGVSLEFWSKQIDDGTQDADFPWAWWVMPRARNLRVGDRTFGSGAVPTSFAGQAYENENWFDGPLNDWPSTSDRVLQWIPSATIPEAACGYASLASS